MSNNIQRLFELIDNIPPQLRGMVTGALHQARREAVEAERGDMLTVISLDEVPERTNEDIAFNNGLREAKERIERRGIARSSDDTCREQREQIARYVADILDEAGMDGESMAKAIRAMPEKEYNGVPNSTTKAAIEAVERGETESFSLDELSDTKTEEGHD